jgi:hypothetical protein
MMECKKLSKLLFQTQPSLCTRQDTNHYVVRVESKERQPIQEKGLDSLASSPRGGGAHCWLWAAPAATASKPRKISDLP